MGEKKLIEILRTKEKEDTLFNKLNEIKAKAEPLLAKITETFPEYTIHDIRHSEKVLEKLDVVIPDSLKQEMNVYEIFFLIASAYLHDIGMVDFPELIEKHREEFEEFTKKEKLKEPEISDEEAKRRFIREHHHLRSEEYIVEHYAELGIENEHQARIIGTICRGHRKEDLSNRKRFMANMDYKINKINEPLLSVFLRIADELDIDFERAPLIIYNNLKPTDPISMDEWEKNQNVSGATCSKGDIHVSAVCKKSKIHRALKMLEREIQDELFNLPDYLHHYREFRKELPVRIIVNIKPEGYKPYDIKFRLREREITQLLMGEKLYESKDACIRELLQNAVDACRMRRELLKKEGLDYKPEVTFELTSDGKIIVSDNGTGMDEYIVENYFAQIGRCFYTSPDFKFEELKFTPISRFGIGILSCFMIADKLEVETKKERDESLLIEIDKMFDYFFVKEGKRRHIGTAVTLFLKEEVRKEIEEGRFNLEKIIRHYARHIEFPIVVKLPDRSVVVKDRDYGLEGQYRLLYKPISSEAEEMFQKTRYGIPVNKNGVQGMIMISLANLSSTEESSRAFISNRGILICENPYLLPVCKKGLPLFKPTLLFKGLFLDLNIESDILDLNISRSRVIENEKFHKFRDYLENGIINAFEEFVENFSGTQTPLGPFDFNLFLENYMPDPSICHLWPDSFINLARKYYKFLVFTKEREEVSNMSYEEIMKSGREVTFIETLPEEIIRGEFPYFKEIVKEIVNNCSGFKQGKFYLMDTYKDKVIMFGNDSLREISKPLTKFFKIEELTDLNEIVPIGIKLVRFKNYKTNRFIEDFDFPIDFNDMPKRKLYLNAEHKFSELLINKKNDLSKDTNAKKLVREFFKGILIFGRSIIFIEEHLETMSFQDIFDKQRQILEWFTEKGLVSEKEMKDYKLTREDFPQIWFYLEQC